MNKLHIDSIQSQFRSNQPFSNTDLTKFYRTLDSGIENTTVNWRIYNLVQHGIINRIGRGKYTLGASKAYIPELTGNLIAANKRIKSDFPFLKVCFWSTSVLNEFMIHQPGKHYLLVEVEKDSMESIFFYLKDRSYTVYLEPSEELIRRYLIHEKEPWIVKPLVTEAPTQQVKSIQSVTIEKLLVDIFCDPLIFSAQQGSEMKQIFKEAFKKYTISESKMMRYASRRNKSVELNKYLEKVLGNHKHA